MRLKSLDFDFVQARRPSGVHWKDFPFEQSMVGAIKLRNPRNCGAMHPWQLHITELLQNTFIQSKTIPNIHYLWLYHFPSGTKKAYKAKDASL